MLKIDDIKDRSNLPAHLFLSTTILRQEKMDEGELLPPLLSVTGLQINAPLPRLSIELWGLVFSYLGQCGKVLRVVSAGIGAKRLR